MNSVEQNRIPARYHDKLVDWQRRYFPDLPILKKYWSRHFPGDDPFQLTVKLAATESGPIQRGIYKGRDRFTRAGDMKGNMLYSALGIIRAQCSTELGSIQQHRDSVDQATSEYARFSILRIMAEEFRHAYQMFWVLCSDDSWSQGGVRNLADDTMDELLAMYTGSHVLDAFNIPFSDALDNIVFAFLIDRVGKYQLSMQKVFSYQPVAYSMGPMLREESFHLKTGFCLLKEVLIAAVDGDSSWSIGEIQKRINVWYPRALEMFGHPDGGTTNILFSFKDRNNQDSVSAYIREVARLVDKLNLSLARHRHPDLVEMALEERITSAKGTDYLYLPEPSFFRMRGPEEFCYQPYSTDGRVLPSAAYKEYLRNVLPSSLLEGEFFGKYVAGLDDRQLQ